MKCISAPGASLGILLLALLKGAASVPVSDDGAVAILDLGEPRGLSYSKRVTLAVKKWAKETQNCPYTLEISYEKNCHRLGSPYFTFPLFENQRLVLEKPKESEQGRYFPVKPKLVEMRCDHSMNWWGPLQKCLEYSDVDTVCGEDKIFNTDLFGDVYCDCIFTKGQLTEDADCHEYYQQGPCKSDEVLVFDVVSELGKCAPDLCYKENKLWAADEKKAEPAASGAVSGPTQKMFAPLNGTGPCLKLMSSDGCDLSGNLMFLVDFESKLPRCFYYGHSPLAGVDVPPCQNFDSKNLECSGKFNVAQGSEEPYKNANHGNF